MHRRIQRDGWCVEQQKVNDVQELMVLLRLLSKQRLYYSCFRKTSCVQVWGFARGALTLLCPPTQVLYCSQEMCPLQRQAGNLSLICGGDCHRVGRLGRSAWPHSCSQWLQIGFRDHNQHLYGIVSPFRVECGLSQITETVIQLENMHPAEVSLGKSLDPYQLSSR